MNVPYNALEEVARTKVIKLSDTPVLEDAQSPGFLGVIHTRPDQGFVRGAEGEYLHDEQGRRIFDNYTQAAYEIYDMAEQFAKEDGLFTGTQGELTLRLIAAMVNTPLKGFPEGSPDEAQESLELKARLVFFGHKVWASDTEPWDEKDFSRTVPKKNTADKLAAATSGSQREVTFYYNAADLRQRMREESSVSAWVSADASCCGSGTSKELISKLTEKGILDSNMPIFVVKNASPILGALVQLTPAKSLNFSLASVGVQNVRVSVCPYLDLKVGAMPPWLLLSNELIKLNPPVEALAASPSPAFFLANLIGSVWAPDSPLGKQLLEVSKGAKDFAVASTREPEPTDLVIAEFETESKDIGLAIGFYGSLLEELVQALGDKPVKDLRDTFKSHIKWTKLTAFKLWLLFGPPLHLFDPDAVKVGLWESVYQSCRLEPGVPKLQQPARIKQGSPEETAFAKEALDKLTTSGWMSEDKAPRQVQRVTRLVQQAQRQPAQRPRQFYRR